MLILSRAGRPIALLGSEPGASGLSGRDKLDEIGEEEMAWDEKIQTKPQLNIAPAKVMTPNTDENAVLSTRSVCI